MSGESSTFKYMFTFLGILAASLHFLLGFEYLFIQFFTEELAKAGCRLIKTSFDDFFPLIRPFRLTT